MQEDAEPEAKRKDEDKQGQARTPGVEQEQTEEEGGEEEEAREEEGEEGEKTKLKDDKFDEEERGPRGRSRSPYRLVRTKTAPCEPWNADFRVWGPSPITIKVEYLRAGLAVNNPDTVLGEKFETYFHPSQRPKLWTLFLSRPNLKKPHDETEGTAGSCCWTRLRNILNEIPDIVYPRLFKGRLTDALRRGRDGWITKAEHERFHGSAEPDETFAANGQISYRTWNWENQNKPSSADADDADPRAILTCQCAAAFQEGVRILGDAMDIMQDLDESIKEFEAPKPFGHAMTPAERKRLRDLRDKKYEVQFFRTMFRTVMETDGVDIEKLKDIGVDVERCVVRAETAMWDSASRTPV